VLSKEKVMMSNGLACKLSRFKKKDFGQTFDAFLMKK